MPDTRSPDAAGRGAPPPHPRTLLFETARGQVRRCVCCDRLEMRFGNALIALGADELPHVLRQLGEAEGPPGVGGEATLLLAESGCGWVFTRDEVAELHRLAAGARLMLDLA